MTLHEHALRYWRARFRVEEARRAPGVVFGSKGLEGARELQDMAINPSTPEPIRSRLAPRPEDGEER